MELHGFEALSGCDCWGVVLLWGWKELVRFRKKLGQRCRNEVVEVLEVWEGGGIGS